ncbi:hypothetical protein SADUNF_Sadunf08G0135700 [Salix dunnii]|uniref:Uncharacterized protein n=1 Tax=Salix dunnii TaxID=1413687 RepID=A0A835JY90_9ROSI|nr:hypothetical protein SADUNF_Sadunf08G0135700 [Salix dunnii]
MLDLAHSTFEPNTDIVQKDFAPPEEEEVEMLGRGHCQWYPSIQLRNCHEHHTKIESIFLIIHTSTFLSLTAKQESTSYSKAVRNKDKTMECSNEACKLAATLFELLYEALELKPEPRRDGLCERTCSSKSLLPSMPVAKIYVPPVHGTPIFNIVDLSQASTMISDTDSCEITPYIYSQARKCRAQGSIRGLLLHSSPYPLTKIYGTIKELLLEDNPPIDYETTVKDFISFYDSKEMDGNFALYTSSCGDSHKITRILAFLVVLIESSFTMSYNMWKSSSDTDQTGGLQVLRDNQRAGVKPIAGSVAVLLQVDSTDRDLGNVFEKTT